VKRFVFALDKVLHYKQQRERLAEARQQQLAAALQARESEVTALRDQLRKACTLLPSTADGTLDTGAWLAGYWHAVQLGQAVQAAEQRVALATAEYQQAATKRQQAAKEVEILVTLRQQRWQMHQQEVGRQRQEQLDEMGMRRWSANRANQVQGGEES
jgi:flagellar export protein FliJ